MNIPDNRPVKWQDVEDLRQHCNLSVKQICECIGIQQGKWRTLDMNSTVEDPAVEQLIRIYSDYPHLMPLPGNPDMRRIYAEIQKMEEIDKRDFGVYFGRTASASYSWLDYNKKASPPVRLLALAMKRSTRGFPLVKEYALKTARARKIDPWKKGNWNDPEKKPPHKRKKKVSKK